MSMRKDKFGGNAIVIGASIAGLLAARTLAGHFEQVTLLERDAFPALGENRKGVPQGKHVHVLLELGRQTMERYLPGLTDDLVRHGAVLFSDVSANIGWFHSGSYHQPGESGITRVGISRPTLEALVRAHILALPNVRTLENCNVLGLVTEARRSRITGVRLKNRQTDKGEETMLADLVVDASGRGSRGPQWLKELGYERPEEEEVRINLGITTCFFRRKPEHLAGLNGIVIMVTPPDKRLGVILDQEDSRWVVTIGSYLGHQAPTDYQGFLEAARSLPAPEIYNTIQDAELLSGPHAHTFPSNLRRHYEKLDRFPEGYLVVGDALCSFNPIYGQGMTVAAIEAAVLDRCLSGGREQLAKRFFSKANSVIDVSWNAATGNDLSFPEVEGRRTPMMRFLNWYLRKLHRAAHQDEQVSIAFLKVINMVAPPPTLLHPRIAWRVFKGNLRPVERKAEVAGKPSRLRRDQSPGEREVRI